MRCPAPIEFRGLFRGQSELRIAEAVPQRDRKFRPLGGRSLINSETEVDGMPPSSHLRGYPGKVDGLWAPVAMIAAGTATRRETGIPTGEHAADP